MKIVFLICIILIGFFAYESLRKERLRDQDLQSFLRSKNSESSELEKSLEKILPKVKKEKVTSEEGVESHKTIDIATMNSEELQQEFQKQWKEHPDLGLDFLRKVFFEQSVFSDTKEELLEQLSQGDFPLVELRYLTREILGRPAEPEIFNLALQIHSIDMSVADKKRLAKELLERTHDPQLRAIVLDFQMPLTN